MKFRKSEDIFHLIGEADEAYLADARKGRARPRTYRILIPLVAAMLATLLFVSGAFSIRNNWLLAPFETTGTTEGPFGDPLPFALTAAVRPLRAQYPTGEWDHNAYTAWSEEISTLRDEFRALSALPTEFFEQSIAEFLSCDEAENRVYSPLNVYMALAMLAETAGGESRAEILTLLGEDSIEDLRRTASTILQTHHRDDGLSKTLLAASFWLRDGYNYKKVVLTQLAESYYADAFSGEMGSEAYNEALRGWLNEQTGGLLADQIGNVELDSLTVIALATTLYFHAAWEQEFYEQNNTEEIFRGETGDVLTTFMHRTWNDTYYDGNGFSAVRLGLNSGGGMYLLLPDEGDSIADLLQNEAALAILSAADTSGTESLYREIQLSLPKFDVSSQIDLMKGLSNLGVRSALDRTRADFSPLTDQKIWVTSATHGARVMIDEKGCTGAAFTVIQVGDEGVPPQLPMVEFNVDRPFLFVVTSDVGVPLFVGAVNVVE